MKSLPEADATLLIRTDFSDQTAWQTLLSAVAIPTEDGFLANLHIVDDPAYRDLTAEELVALAPADDPMLIVADTAAVTTPEMPLLVLMTDEDEDDAEDDDGPKLSRLRVVAMALWAVELNISLANMDWEDFEAAADDDGVFRGF
jgi:hypothetical protein